MSRSVRHRRRHGRRRTLDGCTTKAFARRRHGELAAGRPGARRRSRGPPVDPNAKTSGLASPAEAANDMRMAQLARTIEQEIIPRLMLAHRASVDAPARPADAGRSISRDEVQHFAKLVLSAEEDAAFSAVLAYRAPAACRSNRSISTCWRRRPATSAICGPRTSATSRTSPSAWAGCSACCAS